MLARAGRASPRPSKAGRTSCGKERYLMAVEEDEVRRAAEQFYAAQTRGLNGDFGPMEELWSHASGVSVMPPSGGRVLGWEEVRAAWERAARAFSGGEVTLEDVVV